VRTSLGVMALTAYGVLMITGGNDIIADKFDISLNAMTWFGRLGFVVLPPIAYALSYRICLGLERHDREVLEHGIETGVIRRLPHGEFIEVHQPLGPVDEHGHGTLAYGGASVPKKMNQVGGARRAIKGFFKPIEEPAAVQAEAERSARGLEAEHSSRELTGSGRPSEGGRPQEPRD
jgi:ubiquinol-cytochrome c reductase cytochrome b subunit